MRILLFLALGVLLVSATSTGQTCTTDAECTDVVTGGSCCLKQTSTLPGASAQVIALCAPISTIGTSWPIASAAMKMIMGTLDWQCMSGTNHYILHATFIAMLTTSVLGLTLFNILM